MRSMKNFLPRIVHGIVLLLSGLIMMPSAWGAEPIRIGVITTLTGPEAPLGSAQKNGYDLALKAINAKGGVLGRPVELVYEDDGGKTQGAISAVESLIGRHKVAAIIGAYTSQSTFAAAGIANRSGIPFLCPTGASDEITRQGFEWVYRINAPSLVYASSMMEALRQTVKPKSVAIIHESTLFGSSTAKSIQDDAKKSGIEVRLVEQYEKGAADFKPALLKIKGAQPDVVFMVSYVQDAILLMRQAHEVDLNPKLFAGAGAGFTTPEFLEGAGRDAEYLLTNTQWAPDQPFPGSKEFAADYQKAYGRPATYHGAEGHAALLVVADALKRAGATEPAKLRDALNQTDLMTPFGPVKFESFDGFTHQNRHEMPVLQILNGRYVTVWPPSFATGKPLFPVPPWKERVKK